jgi:hypothetical protein
MRTFASPPAGFDVQTATEEALQLHGFPRRPDPVTEPGLHELWQRAFREPVEFVEAELEVDPDTSYDEFTDHNWGGLGIRQERGNREYNRPATMVFADLQVPSVSDLNPTGEPMIVGFWGRDRRFVHGR